MRTLILILALASSANAATPAARATNILTGALDAAPTNGQSTAVLDAYVSRLSEAQCQAQFSTVCASLTPAQKSMVFVITVKREIRNVVAEHQRAVAAAEAQAAIEAAAAAGGNTICTEPC